MKHTRLPLWLAHKFYARSNRRHNKVYALVRFAIPAIALSLAVMLLSVTIIEGFQHSVHDTVRLFTGDFVICEYGKQPTQLDNVVTLTPRMRQILTSLDEIASVRPVRSAAGMIKTDSDYIGVAVTGAEGKKPFDFLAPLLYEGSLQIPDSVANPIVLPRIIARRMELKVGDKVRLYFINDRIAVRAFTLIGTLELTNTAQPVAYTTNEVLGRVHHWQDDQYSRIELLTTDRADQFALSDTLIKQLSATGVTEQALGIYSGAQINAGIYQWIDSLNPNVQILLILMGLVAAFTMINALLIIILDMTRTIGVLKALGMRQRSIAGMTLAVATRIVLWGMLWGNLLAALIVRTQQQWHWMTLDPNIYYISYVSMIVRPIDWLLINAATLLLCLLLMLLPARIISRITPANSLRFE